MRARLAAAAATAMLVACSGCSAGSGGRHTLATRYGDDPVRIAKHIRGCTAVRATSSRDERGAACELAGHTLDLRVWSSALYERRYLQATGPTPVATGTGWTVTDFDLTNPVESFRLLGRVVASLGGRVDSSANPSCAPTCPPTF